MADTIVAPKTPTVNAPTDVRSEVSVLLKRYEIIRDVIEQKVDEKGEIYLPCPSGIDFADRTDEEKVRYRNYVTRAIFYNFLGRTLTGFIGQIFSREALVKNPTSLDAMVKDATGDGLSLIQLAKDACAEVLSVGRYGLLVDYPSMGADVPSKQDIIDGKARPVILPFKAENITDWDYKKVGAKWVLCYVVLKETFNERDPVTNKLTITPQWRVLDIDDKGFYRQRVYREKESIAGAAGFVAALESYPKADGKLLGEIPFSFCGAINNDANPDLPPMYDMAKINIGHYRNSADYEESVFFIGQPTFVVTGISKNWWEGVLFRKLRFGSRHGIALEKDSDAKLIQAEPNVLAKEAMDAKKEQLAAMGAEFLREQTSTKTATEASINDSSRTSALSNAANNVSAAFQFAMEWAAIFQGEAETTVEFKLNSEFDLARMTEAQRKQLLTEYQADVISWTEMRDALRKAGIATEDDAKVKKEVEEKAAKDLEKMANEFAVNNPDVPTPSGEE